MGASKRETTRGHGDRERPVVHPRRFRRASARQNTAHDDAVASAAAMPLNTALSCVPTSVTAAMMTTEMRRDQTVFDRGRMLPPRSPLSAQ